MTGVLPPINFDGEVGEDNPVYFDPSRLPGYLEDLSVGNQGGPNTSSYISTLTLRIRSMLAEKRLRSVIAPEDDIPFHQWLADHIGDNQATRGPLAIIDLSLVPSDMIHIMVAVLGRIVFEALQRYRRQQPDGKPLPTVLVLEEAHTFVHRGREDQDSGYGPAALCRETFERIAREGRKFGLGLVLSSQRPSELSPTVLAQCNTFLLHRLVNDKDQELVSRLVPDNLGGLLRELPSLPSRQAILLGWATPIPVLVEIDELPDPQRPQSADPDFWEVWTHQTQREVDWSSIAAEWSGRRGEGGGDETPLQDD